MNEKILKLAQTAGYGSRWNTIQELEQFLERFYNLVWEEGYADGYQDGIDESCYND